MHHRHFKPVIRGLFAARTKQLTCLLITAASVLASPAVRATLGGLPSPDDRSERSIKHASRLVLTRSGYDLRQLTLDSGTVVREFVGPSGRVFGVAWQGPFKPDLNLLLGEHFPRFVAAGQKPHGDHRMLRVREPDLVIESGGKMRGFAGHAYLPAMVPANVSVDEIR